MKSRFAALLLCVAVSLAMVACGKKADTAAGKAEVTSSESNVHFRLASETPLELPEGTAIIQANDYVYIVRARTSQSDWYIYGTDTGKPLAQIKQASYVTIVYGCWVQVAYTDGSQTLINGLTNEEYPIGTSGSYQESYRVTDQYLAMLQKDENDEKQVILYNEAGKELCRFEADELGSCLLDPEGEVTAVGGRLVNLKTGEVLYTCPEKASFVGDGNGGFLQVGENRYLLCGSYQGWTLLNQEGEADLPREVSGNAVLYTGETEVLHRFVGVRNGYKLTGFVNLGDMTYTAYDKAMDMTRKESIATFGNTGTVVYDEKTGKGKVYGLDSQVANEVDHYYFISVINGGSILVGDDGQSFEIANPDGTTCKLGVTLSNRMEFSGEALGDSAALLDCQSTCYLVNLEDGRAALFEGAAPTIRQSEEGNYLVSIGTQQVAMMNRKLEQLCDVRELYPDMINVSFKGNRYVEVTRTVSGMQTNSYLLAETGEQLTALDAFRQVSAAEEEGVFAVSFIGEDELTHPSVSDENGRLAVNDTGKEITAISSYGRYGVAADQDGNAWLVEFTVA